MLASQRKLSNLEEQGLIQAFEFTHELAWNTLKDFLESRGASPVIDGSRDATREAFVVGLLTDGEVWMNMIAHRNEWSHTYNQQTADAIAQAILTRYVAEFEIFQDRFSELERLEVQ